MTQILENFYSSVKKNLFVTGDLFILVIELIKASFTRPFYAIKVLEQIISIGVGSLSITFVIGVAMGLVMTLNFGYGLAKFGGTLYVPAMVSLSIAREMAPLFTSLLVAGRVGSGIAAEIGSMSVTQQIDAMRALGTSPIRMLVVPRFWASVISLPLLSALSCAMAIIAGLFVCQNEFGMPYGFYFNKVFETVKFHDYVSGLVKASIFGAIISIVGCYRGLNTKDGTRGVGNATTWVVVTSSILILISDFVISKIFVLLVTK
ncbi:MAG: MlaE family ABC transporter permease [Bacteriovoracaceae bacterium]